MIAALAIPETTGPQAAQERHRQLTDAAHHFEGMFLQKLLETKGVDGQSTADSSDDTAGSDTYTDLRNQCVSEAIARAGGLGIARSIVKQVERSSPQNIPQQR